MDGSNKLEELETEAKNFLAGQWKVVQNISVSSLVFSQVPYVFWPSLPESYLWRVNATGKVELFCHRDAASHDFEIYAYEPDSDGRVNFLVRWDSVTYQTLAYTQAGVTKIAREYPLGEKDFFVGERNYWKGHGIDHADTVGLPRPESFAKRDTSTYDKYNFIPEPLKSYFCGTILSRYVKAIRSKKGVYCKYFYYPDVAVLTRNLTSVPDGMIFAELKTDPSPPRGAHLAGPCPVAVYDVPWSDPIHEKKADELGEHWRSLLSSFRSSDNFVPTPLVVRHEAKTGFNWETPDVLSLLSAENVNVTTLSLKQLHTLQYCANAECLTVFSKAVVLCHYMSNPRKSDLAAHWLQRFVEHCAFLLDARPNWPLLGPREFYLFIALVAQAGGDSVKFASITDLLRCVHSDWLGDGLQEGESQEGIFRLGKHLLARAKQDSLRAIESNASSSLATNAQFGVCVDMTGGYINADSILMKLRRRLMSKELKQVHLKNVDTRKAARLKATLASLQLNEPVTIFLSRSSNSSWRIGMFDDLPLAVIVLEHPLRVLTAEEIHMLQRLRPSLRRQRLLRQAMPGGDGG